MKINFKYVSMLACAALMAGFTSCSDNAVAPEGGIPGDGDGELELRDDDLTIQISVPETKSTRANSESYTNVGIAPYTFDMTLVFVGKTSTTSPTRVLRVIQGDVPALTGAGQKFKNMPLGVTGLYVIGNTEKTNYDMAMVKADPRGVYTKDNFGVLAYKGEKKSLAAFAPQEYEPGKYTYTDVTEFMEKVRISLDNYNLTDAKAVNITGYAPITSTQGTTPVRVVVTPAISRYEIREIKSKNDVKFELKGIYISNTMREISVDGQKYPNASEDSILLNYGWNNPAWNYSLWEWKYEQFDDIVAKKATDSLTSVGVDKKRILIDRNNRFAADDLKYLGEASTSQSVSDYYRYTEFVRATNNTKAHTYDRAGSINNGDGTWTAAPATGIWDKWYDRTKAIGKGKTSYTPADANQFWSFYIASARKQDDPNASPIENPYLDDGYYNRVGLECGYWPYRDEEAFVNAGGTLAAKDLATTPTGTHDFANADYTTVMGVPTWAQRGQGIQYGTFPTINIHVRIEDPTIVANTKSLKEGWLTVTKFYDANTKLPLQYPKPGTVYIIKTVAFDAEKDLNPDPMWPSEETEISVEVIVEGWVGQETEVGF